MLNKILDEYFSLWGVCSFNSVSHLIKCRAESRLPNSPKSIIAVCFPYLLDEKCYERLNVSRYAAVPDYHIVAKKTLDEAISHLKKEYPENEFSSFADNSPIPEVEAACRAGIGVRGLNSLLITEKYGSYVFIGEIVTDLEIPSGSDEIFSCIRCGKCISACPCNAISENGVNRSACLSDITQRKGELSEEEKNLIAQSGCLWGCDICQTVCPLNRNAEKTQITPFVEGVIAHVDKTTDISGRAFEWRGKNTINRNISILSEPKGN